MTAIPHADELVRRIQALFRDPPAHDDIVPLVAGSPYAEPGDSKPFDIDIPGLGNQSADPEDAATTWLNTPNPTFGGLCPKLFVDGTDQQRALLDTVLSSLEDGAFFRHPHHSPALAHGTAARPPQSPCPTTRRPPLLATGSTTLAVFSPCDTWRPTQLTALLEVAALHGAYATGFVAAPPVRSWAVFQYDIIATLSVVDLGDPAIRAGATTIQELTGDWLGYHHRSLFPLPAHLPLVHSGPLAPTQRLAQRIHTSPSTHGFLAPSVKAPGVANLVLFFARLPAGSVRHTGTAHVTL